MKKENFDVMIIGGGINGVTNLLTMSLSGLKTILVEKALIGRGTDNKAATCASLGLIQGGPQYIKRDLDVVRMDSVDGGLLKSITFNLLKSQELIVPVFKEYKFPYSVPGFGDIYFSAYDDFAKFRGCPEHRMLSRDELYQKSPTLKKGAIAGILYHEWIVDPVKLAQVFAYASRYFRGVPLENTEVIGFEIKNGVIQYAIVKDGEGREKHIYADYFLNMAGAWAPTITKMLGLGESVLRLRPTRGTSIIIGKRLAKDAFFVFNKNNKYIIILPQGDTTLIGPTNYDISPEVYRNPDLLEPEDFEIDELLEIGNNFLRLDKPLSQEDIVKVKYGLRVQLFDPCKNPADVTHEFAIIDHAKHGVYNCGTIVGGKLSISPRMAKEGGEFVCSKLNKNFEWGFHRLLLEEGRKPIFGDCSSYPFLEEYEKKYALTSDDNIKRIALKNRIAAQWNLARHTGKYFGNKIYRGRQ